MVYYILTFGSIVIEPTFGSISTAFIIYYCQYTQGFMGTLLPLNYVKQTLQLSHLKYDSQNLDFNLMLTHPVLAISCLALMQGAYKRPIHFMCGQFGDGKQHS